MYRRARLVYLAISERNLKIVESSERYVQPFLPGFEDFCVSKRYQIGAYKLVAGPVAGEELPARENTDLVEAVVVQTRLDGGSERGQVEIPRVSNLWRQLPPHGWTGQEDATYLAHGDDAQVR